MLEMEPKIAREFFLLSLNPKNGYYYNTGNELHFGIMSGILFDLYLNDKISIYAKKIRLSDSNPTDLPFFDKVITILSSKVDLRITNLLYKMSMRGHFYKKELVNFLLTKNELIKVRKHFLGIPYNRYYIRDREQRMIIIRRMRDILLRNEAPEKDDMMLLSHIRICRLFRSLSDQRDERKQMRKNFKKLEETAKKLNLYPEIYQIQQSLQRAIMTSNAAQYAG